MSLDTYRLTCPQHGTFTGQAGVDHAADCLGRKAFTFYQVTTDCNYRDRVVLKTWKPCDQVVKARPWKAPKAPKEVPAAFLAKMDEKYRRHGGRPFWAAHYGESEVTHEYVTDASEVAA